jgi:hypothetical protein
MAAGIMEIDLHGMNYEQANKAVDRCLAQCTSGTYRVRVIHGYHGGTDLKRMLTEEYGYGRSEKVLRIQPGTNPGITELVLREY